MIVKLIGIKELNNRQNKKTGEVYNGIELHFIREPYPLESFVKGSSVVGTEFIKITDGSKSLVDLVKSIPFGSRVNLVYIQSGQYSNLVSIEKIN